MLTKSLIFLLYLFSVLFYHRSEDDVYTSEDLNIFHFVFVIFVIGFQLIPAGSENLLIIITS